VKLLSGVGEKEKVAAKKGAQRRRTRKTFGTRMLRKPHADRSGPETTERTMLIKKIQDRVGETRYRGVTVESELISAFHRVAIAHREAGRKEAGRKKGKTKRQT